jgi:hypothetical protein
MTAGRVTRHQENILRNAAHSVFYVCPLKCIFQKKIVNSYMIINEISGFPKKRENTKYLFFHKLRIVHDAKRVIAEV